MDSSPSHRRAGEIHGRSRLQAIFKIVEVTNHGCSAEATQTASPVPGAILRHEQDVETDDHREGSVGNVPPVENAILLKLRLSAMTAKDLEDLAFVAQQADVVELSFVNTPRDAELINSILHCGGRDSLLSC